MTQNGGAFSIRLEYSWKAGLGYLLLTLTTRTD